jgi:hypothetical protein
MHQFRQRAIIAIMRWPGAMAAAQRQDPMHRESWSFGQPGNALPRQNPMHQFRRRAIIAIVRWPGATPAAQRQDPMHREEDPDKRAPANANPCGIPNRTPLAAAVLPPPKPPHDARPIMQDTEA